MSGYVTESRPVGQTDLFYEERLTDHGVQQWIPHDSGRAIQAQQRTTSFRTRGEVSESDEAEQWSKVTRNGFLTTDPVFDRGHEFYTTRTSARLSHPQYELWRTPTSSTNQVTGYRGPLIVRTALDGNYSFKFPEERRLTANEIRSYGAKSISKSAPTSPSADLIQAGVELARDGIPKIPLLKDLSRAPSLTKLPRPAPDKRLGEELLNFQFGWVPLISDIRKTVGSLQSATTQARQLVRDSGKQVRRTYRFPVERSIIHAETLGPVDSGSVFRGVSVNLFRSTGVDGVTGSWRKVQRTTTSSRYVYFKGAFTYYMPDDKSVWGRIERYEQLANKMLGTRFNAEDAWNLTAWSWLVDWFVDVGTVMSNAAKLSEDGLVLRYGYLMSHTVDEIHHTAQHSVPLGGELGPVTVILRRESKERVRATPFGFGLNTAAFTPRQWAILYALGFTKGDRRLR